MFLGPEYGTTEAAWKGGLVEAERLCDVHNRIKDDLCNEVIQQVKTWQKDNYHKVNKISTYFTILLLYVIIFLLKYIYNRLEF